jgi:hypothetical protein
MQGDAVWRLILPAVGGDLICRFMLYFFPHTHICRGDSGCAQKRKRPLHCLQFILLVVRLGNAMNSRERERLAFNFGARSYETNKQNWSSQPRDKNHAKRENKVWITVACKEAFWGLLVEGRGSCYSASYTPPATCKWQPRDVKGPERD